MINEDEPADENKSVALVKYQNDEEKHLRLYGVRIAEQDAPEIRRVLRELIDVGPNADTSLMRLCCVQLFSIGQEEDILLIWKAKMSGFDAGCSIDVQLLFGGGLEATVEYLERQPEEDAKRALNWLREREDLSRAFSVGDWLELEEDYFRD